MKHNMTRHASGPSMIEVMMKHSGSKRDAGGSVPPSGYFKEGGSVKGNPSKGLTRGDSTGKEKGKSPAHTMWSGHATRNQGGAMCRAMGGVGKLRHS